MSAIISWNINENGRGKKRKRGKKTENASISRRYASWGCSETARGSVEIHTQLLSVASEDETKFPPTDFGGRSGCNRCRPLAQGQLCEAPFILPPPESGLRSLDLFFFPCSRPPLWFCFVFKLIIICYSPLMPNAAFKQRTQFSLLKSCE
ncbi:hypothetical protein AVEN_267300-1 [Araneus ventricosus]|uniref:Uncharacterized protein n=1 Tax=Araneus ventricosus TaxID=182803 RepID=A0A4Y2DJD1_ARAVE|nr:hypothetical protein AVEN_267300-1 [Araneus ventricosus]